MSTLLLKRPLRRHAFCSILPALTLLPVLLLTHSSLAADATWTGPAGTQLWSTGTNWSTNPAAPGATTGTTNGDTATFNTALGATTITIDAGRNLRGMIFDVGASGGFTIGSVGANLGETLLLTSGGSIVMNFGTTTQVTLNAPMVIEPTSGTGSGTYTFSNNATATGSTDTNPYPMTINGSVSGGATTGTITLNFTATTGNRSADATANIMNGLISDGLSAGLSVNVTGTSGGQLGVWRFNNNNNSYTGTTSVSTGTLIFTSIANAGVNSSIGAGSTLNVGSGSHVKYVGGAAATDRAITGNGLFYNNGSGALTLNGTIAAGLTFRGNQNFIVNGLISGNSSISRTDGGTVFLNNNANSFTGDLSISDGAFQAATIFNNGTNSAIGNTGRLVFGQGSATVGRFEYTGNTVSTDRLILMRNDASGSSGRGIINVMTTGQTLTFTNGVRVNNGTAANIAELTLTGVGNGEIQGQIGGTYASPSAVASLQLVKSGSGTWTLSGVNTYTRLTTISAGILNIQNSSALGAVLSNETTSSAANAGTVVASGATLQLQNNISVGAEVLTLAGTGATGQNGALVNVSGANTFAGALTFTANTTISADSGSLALTNTAAIVGSGGSRALTLTGAGTGSLASSMDTGIASVTKNGSGLWTLRGTSSYTGATTVNAGTLNVTGALGNTTVTVNSGGTFAYAGTLGGSLTAANNTTLIIGDVLTAGSTGTLTVGGNLTLNDSTVLQFTLGTASDFIQANGSTVTLDGIVRVATGTGFAAGTYQLLGYTGTLTDNGLVAQALAGYDVSIVVDTVNQAVNLTATGISAQYWDGGTTTADSTVHGGNGIWTNAGTNWTTADGSSNTSWAAATEQIAVFSGATGGTVQVQDTVAVNGLQFAHGYTLADAGGQLQITNPATEVRVDNAVTATVAASVTGAGGINKTGDGTLVFTAAAGTNTYAGGTLVTSGTLQIGATDTLPTATALTLGAGVFTASLDLSSASQQVGSLAITSNNANLYDTITIGAGQTLQVNGAMSIGIPNNVKTQTRALITGPGALVVNNTNAIFDAGVQTVTSQAAANLLPNASSPFDNGANANTALSDFTGLGSFTASVKEFRVGYGINVNSTLLLSDTSNTITANVVQLSNSNGFNSGSSTTVLGAGTNIINTDTLNIGVSKGVATLKFASQSAGSAGTVVIGGKTGATTDITVGSSTGTATGANPTGTLDLRGHTATITVGALIIGKRNSGGGGGSAGTVYFDGGTFTANSVEMGTMSGNSGTNSPGPSGNGTLIISGGTFTVNSGGTFVLATYANTNTFGNAKAVLTVSGGTLISNVDIVEGGGAGATMANTTSTINLTGGTLDLTGHSIGDATNTIDNLTLASGTLKDVAEINGGGDITKSTSGTLVLLGTNTFSGTTTISAGTLQVGSGGTSGTLGSGDVIDNATLAFNRSDLLTVSNNISGSGVVNQTGSGTTVLSGASTYTGQTTVSAGALLVNNAHAGPDSATGTGAVQVSGSATLGGSGNIGGSVTLAANATLAPGGNAASITAGTPGVSTEIGTVQTGGSFTASASSTLAFQLHSGDPGLTATFDPVTSMLTSVSGTATDGGNDRLIVSASGTLTLDAASQISVTAGAGFTPAYQAVFDLIDWTGAAIPLAYYDNGDGIRTGGTADNAAYALDLPDLTSYSPDWFWDVSQFGATGTIAIVPEPSRALLLLCGLLGLGMRRRRTTR